MMRQALTRYLAVILCIIHDIICFIVFNKHVLQPNHMLLTFISWNQIQYLCNMNFSLQNEREWCLLLRCFLQSCLLPMLHKNVFCIKLCDTMSIKLVLDGEKGWRVGKKFFQTNFCFFTPLLLMIFNESN